MVVVQGQKSLVGPACALSQGMRYYYFIKEIYIKCSDDAMIQTVQHWFLKGLLTVVSWPKIWLVIENTTSTPPSVCRYFRHEFSAQYQYGWCNSAQTIHLVHSPYGQ